MDTEKKKKKEQPMHGWENSFSSLSCNNGHNNMTAQQVISTYWMLNYFQKIYGLCSNH